MNRTLSLFVIGLIFGGGIGFTIAAGNGITFDGHDHGDPAQHGAASNHGGADHAAMHAALFDIPASDAPTVAISVTPDPMAGFNLHVMTENFAFSPLNASGRNLTGEGHAHLYVNGVKHGRLYAEWMHLDNLPKGEVEIAVSLNTNDHRPLAVGGSAITARQIIEVK
ncbi:hypothetical protein AB2B41_00590 [Marimonas sp. MJW-29]|uniref:Uncharacterized protein n=1 Tax=Sulfitobacter sediminis TaxID=3234186 RepID=A0ABV3RGT8_9RHOB